MNEIVEKVRAKLRLLRINSCECHTKTPDAQHHDENCGYRLVKEADALLAELASTHTLVPLEPTEAMLDAFNKWAQCEGYVPEGYRAMLAAAGLPAADDAKCLRQDKARDYAAGDGFIVRSRVKPGHSTQPCHPSSAESACGHCDAPPNSRHSTRCDCAAHAAADCVCGAWDSAGVALPDGSQAK